jgi:hypothetical protein
MLGGGAAGGGVVLFAGIRPGDDAAIAAVLARDHPVYADHPQITLDERAAMIVGLRRDRG